jgi:hypothetical protein
MAILNIHWNFVRCLEAVNLEALAKDSAISYAKNVEPNCRGVYFRSVLTEELDFSETLKGLKFEDVRRQRQEGGNELLFSPKPLTERSIGVLRIMKPKRFNRPKGINTTGKSVSMVSRSKDYDVLLETTEFVLEDAQEQMQERFQLQETFGDFNVFFFGKRAEIFTYSGSLLNGCKDLQWRNQFLSNYDRFLRGTRCVELKARAYFLYDDIIREGFILSAATMQNSTVDGVVKFSFTMLITDKRIMGYVPENRKADPLTLDRVGSTRQGGHDFRFFKSTDPNLPLVAKHFETGEDGEIIPIDSSAFFPDESLGLSDPPEDLRVQMQNLTLRALDEVGEEGVTQISDESLDSDILLDFIHSSDLGANTKLIVAGVPSLDTDGLKGDELVLLLTGTSPSLTLSGLRFKQAISAALSFGTTNAALAGSVASELSELATFFAKDGTFRSKDPHTQTADFKTIFAGKGNKNFILLTARDDDFLDTLISSVEPIAKFNKDEMVKAAVATVRVTALSHFLTKDQYLVVADFSVAELYVSALALLRNPVNLNPFAAFSEFTGDVNQFPSSIDYVRSQAFSKFSTVALALPGNLSASLDAAIDNFKASTYKGLIEAAFPGQQIDGIPLSEFTLLRSTTGVGTPASEESTKFMMQVSVYLTGLVSEFFGSGVSTSFDITGGTVLDVKDLDAAKTAYFVKQYADSLKPGTNKVLDWVWLNPEALGSGAIGPDVSGSKYIARPVGLTKGEQVMFGPGLLVNTLNPDQKSFMEGGYVRLPSNHTTFNNHIIVEAEVRKAAKPLLDASVGSPPWVATQQQINQMRAVGSYWGTTPIAAGPITSDAKFASGRTISSTIRLDRYPARRNYVGSGAREYRVPTLKTLKDIAVTTLGGFIKTEIPKISSAMDTAVKSFISDGIPPDVEQKPIREELAIGKLNSNPAIVTLNEKLVLMGATVSDFIDLLFVADHEKEMAVKITRLKQLLGDAIKNANGDILTGSKASNVKDSDKATTKAICHKNK